VLLGIDEGAYTKSILHDSLDEVVPKEVLQRDLYEGSWRRFVAGEQRRCDAPE
jgi:hypothetical protein